MEMDADNADFESQSKSESECEYGLVPAGKQEKIRNNAAHSAIGLGGKKKPENSVRNGEAKGKSFSENKTTAKLNRKSFGSNKTFPFRCSEIMCK